MSFYFVVCVSVCFFILCLYGFEGVFDCHSPPPKKRGNCTMSEIQVVPGGMCLTWENVP